MKNLKEIAAIFYGGWLGAFAASIISFGYLYLSGVYSSFLYGTVGAGGNLHILGSLGYLFILFAIGSVLITSPIFIFFFFCNKYLAKNRESMKLNLAIGSAVFNILFAILILLNDTLKSYSASADLIKKTSIIGWVVFLLFAVAINFIVSKPSKKSQLESQG